MIRLHIEAFKERLELDGILKGATFDTTVDGDPERYCVFYTNQGRRYTDRKNGPANRAAFEFTVHSIGRTADQCRLVAERVMAQALDFRPVIAGRSCWPITHEASQPIKPDTDGPVTKFYAVDVFRLESTPG